MKFINISCFGIEICELGNIFKNFPKGNQKKLEYPEHGYIIGMSLIYLDNFATFIHVYSLRFL